MDSQSYLSLAAAEWIERYVQRQTAQAAGPLNRRQTEEELLRYLSSGEKMNTPGFVLRRHIQAQGLVRGEDCADLRRAGNRPWPPESVLIGKPMGSIAAALLDSLMKEDCEGDEGPGGDEETASSTIFGEYRRPHDGRSQPDQKGEPRHE